MPTEIEWHFIGHLQSNKVTPRAHSSSYIDHGTNPDHGTAYPSAPPPAHPPTRLSTRLPARRFAPFSFRRSVFQFVGVLVGDPQAKSLVEGVPNLAMIETIDTDKLAKKVDAACSALERPPLPVMVQVTVPSF